MTWRLNRPPRKNSFTKPTTNDLYPEPNPPAFRQVKSTLPMVSPPLFDAVTEWLNNIPACDDFPDSCRAGDGSRSILASKSSSKSQKRKRSHLQIPSPPGSENQPRHHHQPTMPSQSGTPKKRKTATVPDDQVDDDTPRPLRLADKSETPSLSSLSSQSLMGSQHSGRSSPSKLASHLRLDPQGLETVAMDVDDADMPESLVRLVAEMQEINDGLRVIHKSLRPSIEKLKSTSRSFALLRGSAYMDSADTAIAPPEPTNAKFPEKHLDDIMDIVDIAKECQGADVDEICWNNHVHSPLLHAALNRRPVPGQPISFTACMNASITPNYRVSHVYSSKVDYVIFINPTLDKSPESTNAQRAVQHLQRYSPDSSVNHTAFSLLRDRPIAISIETKRYGGQERKAEFQLGIWLAAQWKLLAEQAAPEGLRELAFIPGIIVNGHEWKMVAATYADGKTKLWTNQEFGTTRSVLRTFQIVAALRRLRQWSLEEYWPWYKRYVLKIGSDEGIETVTAESSS